ncbi:helix-turn-helix domain-containing protein [Mammaliicoccus sciuri]|nr:helix-turn-helix domain-containing protein [Mammaliicoccus sciuri]
MNQMIDILKRFGLSEYGSKAYIALVQNPGITAYKLSEISSVPRSKIYEDSINLMNKDSLISIYKTKRNTTMPYHQNKPFNYLKKAK